MTIKSNAFGFLVISDIIGGQLVTERYQGYTRKQAIRLFNAKHKQALILDRAIKQMIFKPFGRKQRRFRLMSDAKQFAAKKRKQGFVVSVKSFLGIASPYRIVTYGNA